MSSEKQVHPGPRRNETKYAVSKDLENLWEKIVSDWELNGKDSFIFQFLSSQKEGKRDMVKFVESYLYDIETGRRSLSKQPLCFVPELCEHLGCSANDLFEQDSGRCDMESIKQLLDVHANFWVPLQIDPYSGDVVFLKKNMSEKSGMKSCLISINLTEEYESIYNFLFKDNYGDYQLPMQKHTIPKDWSSHLRIPEKRIFVADDDILINRVPSLDSIPSKYRAYFIEDPLLKDNRKMDLDKQIDNATISRKQKTQN